MTAAVEDMGSRRADDAPRGAFTRCERESPASDALNDGR